MQQKRQIAEGINTHSRFLEGEVIKPFMLVIGDNLAKDGGAAERARLPFGHVPFMEPNTQVDPNKGQFAVPNFNWFYEFVMASEDKLRAGQSWSEIILGIKDRDMFPPLSPEQVPWERWRRGDPALAGAF